MPDHPSRAPRPLGPVEAVVVLNCTTDPGHKVSTFLVMAADRRPTPIPWRQEDLVEAVVESPQRFLAPRPEATDPRTVGSILARQGHRLAIRHPAHPDRGWVYCEVYPECP